ncbi:MAG: hypothetical protein A3A58_02715 [Candidatus Blackburnbacteria bacterium RIFCSPLOWO2_01_FULL_41_27]|uniref:Uncharacterized protein n=2 Tax=Candidatus Blackburniibacteriota TaxID=1817898 RepID=A0A1G1VB03_9BACT|nr:MAG: hypothetical protein A3F61_03785 [Candidatus Blackburnbacteria bacterium RIFCSPHIGHO2_12_FULL_41_13b]OGY14403.1 MAG: hypothetical protein A3A58_02715 [Candidatus Blackburnbacteria bacterium RIFCSPLOWO2_01_FULL_41_27]
MDDTKKMLRAIINGQSALKAELLTRFEGVEKKLDKRIDEIQNKMDKGFTHADKRFDEVNSRIDKLGRQLAYLEDDAPTKEEHDKLEKRVTKLEHHAASTA